MFGIVDKRHWYFLLSALIIIPGLIAMGYSIVTFGSPIKLGIDFTGGALLELQFEQELLPGEVRDVFVDRGYPDTTVQSTGDRTVLIRTKPLDPETKDGLEDELVNRFGPMEELRFESVGPAVGAEVTRAAGIAVGVAALFILLFIIFSFRKVPNAVRFGVCAISAMLHDILVTLGLGRPWPNWSGSTPMSRSTAPTSSWRWAATACCWRRCTARWPRSSTPSLCSSPSCSWVGRR